jgi:hypothetical protein
MDTRNIDRPPCWRAGEVCPNRCAAALYFRIVWNETELHGPWSGWRLRGGRLISPHGEWASAAMVDRWLLSHWRLFEYAGRTAKERATRVTRSSDCQTTTERQAGGTEVV